MLDVRRLRLLYELSRRGTIAAVGRALHLSPSGVSQQLAQLETEAGVRLLDHVGRGVRLTEAARMLAAHAESVLARLEQAETELAVLGQRPTGTVRIASFQTAALALIPELLVLLARHRDLRIELAQVEPEQALPALLAHDHDLVLGEEYPGAPVRISPQLHRVDLCTDPIRLATPAPDPNPGTDRSTVLDRSVGCAWVMEPRGTASRRWATTLCRSAGFEPDVRYESDDLFVHLALAERGLAAAFLPDLIWRRHSPGIALHDLHDLGGPGGPTRTIFTGVRRGSERHPAIRAVRGALRTAAVGGLPNPDR
ncbi:MAG TPA: LysR family transcriptional regulator [Mycobacteriales bacterium]|nr:LysR family transcriptional regulator [Mycobacteriales bacterium]